jgi:hypothetical protein
MRLTGCSETSVTNHRVTQRNIRKARRPQLVLQAVLTGGDCHTNVNQQRNCVTRHAKYASFSDTFLYAALAIKDPEQEKRKTAGVKDAQARAPV